MLFILIEVSLGFFIVALSFVLYRTPRKNDYLPLVSVIVSAYKESPEIIEKSLQSILNQSYKGFIEIIFISDGIKETYDAAMNISLSNNLENRSIIRKLKELNKGLMDSQNLGLSIATGELICDLDCDTILEKTAIEKAAKQFANKKVIALAGSLRPLPKRNFIQKLQTIEYNLVNLTKAGLSITNSVNNISGALGFFRTSSLKKMNGWQSETSEDLCLTIRLKAVIPNGLIKYSDEVIAYTECPSNVVQLIKQRIFWSAGAVCIFTKHFKLLFKMNLVTFINIIIFDLYMEIISPLCIFLYINVMLFSYSLRYNLLIFLGIYVFYMIYCVIMYSANFALNFKKIKGDFYLVIFLPIFPLYKIIICGIMCIGILYELFLTESNNSPMRGV